jgi:hypothetical protein
MPYNRSNADEATVFGPVAPKSVDEYKAYLRSSLQRLVTPILMDYRSGRRTKCGKISIWNLGVELGFGRFQSASRFRGELWRKL